MRTLDMAIFIILVLVVAALGGSSRFDMVQGPPLQLGAWIILGVLVATAARPLAAKPLLFLALAYCGWLALTLIPLPHGVWTMLPGREDIAQLEEALGLSFARPLSLDPQRTLNALGLMAIPLAGILAVSRLGERAVITVLTACVALAVLSATLAFIQQATGQLYLYAITNDGKPVGIFANTNHHAVFVVIGLAIAAWLFDTLKLWPKGFSGFAAVLLFLSALTSTSRGGFLCLLVALAFIAWLAPRRVLGEERRQRLGLTPRRLALVAAGGGAIAVALLLPLLSSVPAIDRIVGADPLQDRRFEILPHTLAMARDFLPFGVGIGAFEDVYYAYELPQNLRPEYVNMAHNDIAQLLAEGGIVMAGFVIAVIVLAIRRARARLGAEDANTQDSGFIGLATAILAILVVASAFDYPLRTAIHQLSATMLLTLLWMPPLPRPRHLR
ncbi:putative binding-protein-dependent transport system protein [Aurantiacibacter gangjinensis]|nr:putative binding-protein-dependent transport system protein [Aurantiacibacter gangjinensis]